MRTFKEFWQGRRKLDETLRDGVTEDGTQTPKQIRNWNKLQMFVMGKLQVPEDRIMGDEGFAKAFGDWADKQTLDDAGSKFLEEFGQAEIVDNAPKVSQEAVSFANGISDKFEKESGWKA